VPIREDSSNASSIASSISSLENSKAFLIQDKTWEN
jgi:hypothetical protein